MSVYLVRDAHAHAVKIGFSVVDARNRLSALQTGSSGLLELVALVPGAGRDVERDLHTQFAAYRLHDKWFKDMPQIQSEFEQRRNEAVARYLDGQHEAIMALTLAAGVTDHVTRLRRPATAGRNSSVLDFWHEFSTRFAWDFLPFTFLGELYRAWAGRTGVTPVSRNRCVSALVEIADVDKDWFCDDRNKKVRPGRAMDADEPLLIEYGLTDWRDGRKRQPSYRGLRRARRHA